MGVPTQPFQGRWWSSLNELVFVSGGPNAIQFTTGAFDLTVGMQTHSSMIFQAHAFEVCIYVYAIFRGMNVRVFAGLKKVCVLSRVQSIDQYQFKINKKTQQEHQ